MGAYPPNSPNPPYAPPPAPGAATPPPAGGQGFPGYPPPGYDARAWKAQARAQQQMWKAQQRVQRDRMRAQYRAARRYSVVGPLLLLLFGVVFLCIETGHLAWDRALLWYGHWWPVLLIGAGLLMLAEWALNGRHGTWMSGGVVTLLVIVGGFGWAVGAVHEHTGWTGQSLEGWGPLFGELHEEDGAPLAAAAAEGGTLLIHNPHGDVNVTGASEDGQVHVSVHKEMRSSGGTNLENDRSALQPSFHGSAAALQLSVGQADGSHADLQVTVPRGVTLTVDAERGGVSVAEMHAPVSISAGRGEVNLSGITGPVTAHLHSRNGSLSAHSVTGGVSVDGSGGDVNLSDIAGPVALQGEFFGTTHMERVNGPVSFETFRTMFKAARLDGELEISRGSRDAPLQGEAILGPVLLHTSDRVITLDRVQGNVEITNSNGSVSLTSAGPLGTVAVHNRRGSVTVSVPSGAGFTLDAQTHDGAIENDFGLTAGGGDRPTLMGTVGHGGPTLTLQTDDGDVAVRKGSAAPLPESAPGTPALTTEPAAGSPAGKPKKATRGGHS